jgi:hypothetical protein
MESYFHENSTVLQHRIVAQQICSMHFPVKMTAVNAVEFAEKGVILEVLKGHTFSRFPNFIFIQSTKHCSYQKKKEEEIMQLDAIKVNFTTEQ